MRKIKIKTIEKELEIVELLKTTVMSCTEIGNLYRCSRGPISKIKCKYGVILRGRKNLPKVCKWCGNEFIGINSKVRPSRGKFCCKRCYSLWQMSDENRGTNNPAWVDGGRHEAEIQRLRKR